MAQVFISYSRKDLTFVEHLISDLKKTGIDVWYDLSGLEGGSRWGTEIKNAIQNSDYVIVVLSPDSVASEWVEREYLLSDNLNKKILPLMYRECDLPLSFLNLNYVDVQGENYVRNFDKITRFLSTTPSSPLSPAIATPVIKRAANPRWNSQFYAVLGVIAVLGVAAMFFLLNGRGAETIPDVNNTTTPVETLVQSTASSDTSMISIMETPSPIPLNATITETSAAPDVMVTSGPTQAETADPNQAVFLKSVEPGNMADNFSDINHPLAYDPGALVFAMQNWTPNEIYNNNLIGVWYRGGAQQWALFNQDMSSMPEDAAFNIQILDGSTSANAFVHTATASNIPNSSNNMTIIEHPLASDPDALVFATFNLSASVGGGRSSSHPIGVAYTGTQWAIVNLDRARMPEGAAFNVQVIRQDMNAFVHTATESNTSKNGTRIDDPVASDQNALVFAMPVVLPGDDAVYNSHPMGVWYTKNRWTIFNQDMAPMPEGAMFNILILYER